MLAPLPPPVGGISTWAAYLLPCIEAHPEVELVHLDTGQRLRGATQTGFLRRAWTGAASWIPLLYRLGKAIARERPDVIHCQTSARLGFFRDWLLIKIAHLMGVPAVIHFHFGRCRELSKAGTWEWKMLRAVVAAADRVIVLDTTTLDTLRGCGYANVHLVPNPVAPDLEAAAAAPDASARSRGQVLFVGHVIAAKGVLELVAACAGLPEVKQLRLIGPVEPAFRAEVEAAARRRPGADWVALEGTKGPADVLDAMRRAGVLALPSHLDSSEAFPIVLLEAMAMGCPVVATTVAAMPDMLDAFGADRAGICVPPRDADALGQAIREILQNPAEAEHMGACGRRRVISCYSMGKVFAHYLSVWREACSFLKN